MRTDIQIRNHHRRYRYMVDLMNPEPSFKKLFLNFARLWRRGGLIFKKTP
jgi:hypothetical protein